jgi:hypothetical protein
VEEQGNLGHGEWGPPTEAWWAGIAVDILHPVQVLIIEAFHYVDQPLSVRDISEMIEDVEPVNLDYHVGRLRTLRIVDFVDPNQRYPGFMDVPYQLVYERRRRRGR